MASEITVVLQEPTEAGRLYPRYDEESELLVVASRVQRDWPYGFNVDGLVIFDADVNRILADFELLAPRRRWEVSREFPKRPRVTRAADVQFTEATFGLGKTIVLPVEVMANKDGSRVLIRVGVPEDEPEAIELSECCLALVDADRLVGFYIEL